jgi:hypothetical protein
MMITLQPFLAHEKRRWSYQCFAITLVLVCQEAACFGQASIDSKAEVYALIVGVTDYGNPLGNASKAAEGAKKFAEVVRKTYGDQAVKQLLIDKDATYDNVAEALQEIQSVPSGSLVIIYFSGHGVRKTFASGSLLYLRLFGSTPDKFAGKSIKATDLWGCLAFTKYTNAMIFLDCCCAGSDEADIVPETTLNDADVRAFLMCACSSNEVATGDVFNRSLLEVWESAHRDNECMTLDDFESRVQKLVRKYDQGYMTPGIAFKTRIARCITHMNEPSTILAFSFPKGCRTGIDFLFDDTVVEQGFQYTKELFFVRQVSLNRPIKVTILGPKGVTIAGPFTIDPRDALPNRILEFKVNVPDKYAALSPADPALIAASYGNLAELVEAYGENPKEYYLASARAFREANPFNDTLRERQKAAFYAPGNKLYAFAAEKGSLPQELISRYADNPSSAFSIVEGLESIGAYKPAAELALSAGEQLAEIDREAACDYLLRAYGNYKIAQSNDDVERLSKSLQQLQLNERQKIVFDSIAEQSISQLAENWDQLPAHRIEWLALRINGLDKLKNTIGKVLVGVSPSSIKALIADVSLLKYENLDAKAQMVYMLTQKDSSVQIVGNDVTLFEKGLLPDDAKPASPWKLLHGENSYNLHADSNWRVKACSLYKPGFEVTFDSQQCWIRLAGSEKAPEDESRVKTFDITDLSKIFHCNAPNLATAIEYVSKKPGYVTRYRDGKLWISEEGQPTIDNSEVTYKQEAEVFGENVEYVFPSKEVAANYQNTETLILDNTEQPPHNQERAVGP